MHLRKQPVVIGQRVLWAHDHGQGRIRWRGGEARLQLGQRGRVSLLEHTEPVPADLLGGIRVGGQLQGADHAFAHGRRIELLAQAVMSIQAVKAVEIGDGFDVAARRGSRAHDAISWDADAKQYRRDTALAGGCEGGISNGDLLVVRASMKPLATLNRPTLKTVDTVTKQETVSFKERTDVTAVPAMGVVAETMVALVLASEALRKFGGDSVQEFTRNARGFRAQL